jgi:hypothetical protein
MTQGPRLRGCPTFAEVPSGTPSWATLYTLERVGSAEDSIEDEFQQIHTVSALRKEKRGFFPAT